MNQIIIGTLICSGIAVFAYRKKSLTTSGLYSALLLGIFLSIFGGLYFLSILVAFFISSNMIGRFNRDQEKSWQNYMKKWCKRLFTGDCKWLCIIDFCHAVLFDR